VVRRQSAPRDEHRTRAEGVLAATWIRRQNPAQARTQSQETVRRSGRKRAAVHRQPKLPNPDARAALQGSVVRVSNPRDVATGNTLWTTVRTINEAISAASDEGFEDAALPDDIFPALAKQVRGSTLESPLRTLAHCATEHCDVTQGLEELLQWNLENADDPALSEMIEADREFLAERWTDYKSTVDRKDRTWQGLLMEILNKPKPEGPGLRILTVHAAKGLEFRAVTVVGFNDGSFPDFRNAEGDALESEQRLAYVAATRAARVLRFSRPIYRATRYGPRLQDESRFVAMAELVATPAPADPRH